MWYNLLPPHQRLALFMHLPKVTLPVPYFIHVHLYVLCFGKELLHVIADGWDVLPWGVIAISALLNISAIPLTVLVLVVILLLIPLLILLLLLRLVPQLLWLPALLVVPTILLGSIIFDYVQEVIHSNTL